MQKPSSQIPLLGNIKNLFMNKLKFYYFSPVFRAREFENISQIEREKRFSQPINDEIDQEQYEFEQSVQKDEQYARYE